MSKWPRLLLWALIIACLIVLAAANIVNMDGLALPLLGPIT